MSKILVIAPHPDDETLGCGGTLFRHKLKGDNLFWIIVTSVNKEMEWSDIDVKNRKDEIKKIARKYGFEDVFNFGLPTTKLDTIPLNELINKIKKVFKKTKAEIIYMPCAYDVHTDHQITAKALQSSLKWFRYPFIRKVLMYETLSETEFNFIGERSFQPNIFVNISDQLDKKIETMKEYKTEMGDFPFPRSEKTIRSLAEFRGSQSGYQAAEAFELVFERRF